jgi:hypothetical protein
LGKRPRGYLQGFDGFREIVFIHLGKRSADAAVIFRVVSEIGGN